MKTVLIVSSDSAFSKAVIGTLSDVGRSYSGLWAGDCIEAGAMLRQKQADGIVVDLAADEDEWCDAVATLRAAHPAIFPIAVGESVKPEIHERLDLLGIFHFLRKSTDQRKFAAEVDSILDRGSRGRLLGVPLPSFVQVLSQGAKTLTLRVQADRRTGVLYVCKGELRDAITGSLREKDAALEILRWDPVDIEYEGLCRKTQKAIDGSLPFLLMESSKLSDSTNPTSEFYPRFEETANETQGFQPDASRSRKDASLLQTEARSGGRSSVVTDPSAVMNGNLKGELDRLKEVLISAVGPIGAVLIREGVGEWAQRFEPSSKHLGALVDILCGEIGDAEVEVQLRKALTEMLANPATSPEQTSEAVPSSNLTANESDVLSQKAHDRILEVLSRVVGPVAVIIMKSAVKEWESQGAATGRAKIGDLINRICAEIDDAAAEADFRSSVQQIVNDLYFFRV